MGVSHTFIIITPSTQQRRNRRERAEPYTTAEISTEAEQIDTLRSIDHQQNWKE